MLPYIIVRVGTFPDNVPCYQLFEKRSNGTYEKAENLADGKPNEPVYVRDARSRMAELSKLAAVARVSPEEFE